MNFENWISYRYLTAKKGRFLSFLSFVSIAGIAIGVMSLIVVLGVMTGFGNNLREKIIGTIPHIVMEKETGLRDYKALQRDLEEIDEVIGTSPYVQGDVFLEENGKAIGQMLRGVDPKTEEKVTKIKEYLIEGSMEDLGEDGIIVGKELARYCDFTIGDQVTLIAPGSGISGKGWRYPLTIVGIFDTGMVDYDSSLGIVSLKKAQEIFNLPQDKVTGVGIKLKHPTKADEVKTRIYRGAVSKEDFSAIVLNADVLWRDLIRHKYINKQGVIQDDFLKLRDAVDMLSGPGYEGKETEVFNVLREAHGVFGYSFLVKTWIDVNRNLFEALFLEKWGLFIILTLMIIVASFNIVSTLIVTVTSKVHDIGILKSFGVTKKSIRAIFTKQGVFIGMVGTALGVMGGVSISFILSTYIKVPAQIYSMDHVPVDLQLGDILIIIAAAMSISYLASIYPAAKAANLQPVEALRYE